MSNRDEPLPQSWCSGDVWNSIVVHFEILWLGKWWEDLTLLKASMKDKSKDSSPTECFSHWIGASGQVPHGRCHPEGVRDSGKLCVLLVSRVNTKASVLLRTTGVGRKEELALSQILSECSQFTLTHHVRDWVCSEGELLVFIHLKKKEKGGRDFVFILCYMPNSISVISRAQKNQHKR